MERLSFSSLFTCHEYRWLEAVVQRLLTEPFNTSSTNQATHTEPDWKKRSHISLRQQALFQIAKFFIPNPPSRFGFVTTTQETLAVWCFSISPCHIKTPQREFIRFTQACGRMKVEHQKVVMPVITVLISSSLPAKDKDFALHEESFVFICWSSTSQCKSDSFFVHKGTPRYRTGREPIGIPVVNWIKSVSLCERPDAKKKDFCTLTARPDLSSNSRSTCKTDCTDSKEPSIKINKSSAKHKWVSLDPWHLEW